MKTKYKTYPDFGQLSQITKAILLLVSVFTLGSCKIFDKAPEAKSPIKINTNPNDPLLARVNSSNTGYTELYGSKNANGVPQTIEKIVMLDNSQSTEANYLNFDEQSRLKSLIGKDGSKYLFNWKSDSKAVLTYVSQDGLKQINTEIDLNETENGIRPNNKNSPEQIIEPSQVLRKGQSIIVEQILEKREVKNSVSYKAKAKFQELKIYVTQCNGLPVDAEEVSVIMYKNPDKLYLERIGEYTAFRVTRGIYSVVMPSEQATKIDVNKVEICNALKTIAAEVACSNVSEILRKLAKIGAKVSIPTTIATEVADQIVEDVCNLMLEQPEDKSCEQNFDKTPINLYTGDVSFIAAVVPRNGGKIKYSSMVIVEGKDVTYPDLKIELGGEIKVNTLTLTPDRPLARQSYVADASFACLPFNTLVTISVIGTDGYKKSSALSVQNLDPNGNFSIRLTVPGALQGVKDDIFLEAKTPAGKLIKQTATLIFQ